MKGDGCNSIRYVCGFCFNWKSREKDVQLAQIQTFRDTHGDQANILVAKAFHSPSESEGVEGGFVQIFRENHGAEFTEGEARLFISKFPFCIPQLVSKFIT